MTNQYDNTNTGAAFQKEGFEGFSGKINVEGKEYWVSVYDNMTKDGKPWRKLVVKQKTSSPAEQKQSASFSDDLE